MDAAVHGWSAWEKAVGEPCVMNYGAGWSDKLIRSYAWNSKEIPLNVVVKLNMRIAEV